MRMYVHVSDNVLYCVRWTGHPSAMNAEEKRIATSLSSVPAIGLDSIMISAMGIRFLMDEVCISTDLRRHSGVDIAFFQLLRLKLGRAPTFTGLP